MNVNEAQRIESRLGVTSTALGLLVAYFTKGVNELSQA